MKLPGFVFLKGEIFHGSELILHTVEPYPIFRVYQFHSDNEMESFIIKYNLLNGCTQIPGYNIALCYVGTLDNVNEVPVLGHSIPKEIKSVQQPLADYYETERITGNESRQKKYKKK